MLRSAAALLSRRSQTAADLATTGSRALAAAAPKEVILPPQYDIPGRYAAALYMAAVKGDKLGAVEKELSQIAALLAESKDFRTFVADPSLPSSARTEGLHAVLGKMGASDITMRFVDLVVENRRVEDLAKIVARFGDIAGEQRGQVKAVVTTAEGLPRAELEQLQGGLKKLLQPGQTLLLEEKIDPSIIAGIIIDIGDKHVDLSVISRVRKLQQIVRDAV